MKAICIQSYLRKHGYTYINNFYKDHIMHSPVLFTCSTSEDIGSGSSSPLTIVISPSEKETDIISIILKVNYCFWCTYYNAASVKKKKHNLYQYYIKYKQ